MAKNRLIRIVGVVLGALLLLLATAVIAVQIPSVQTAIGKKAVEKLSKGMDGELRVGDIAIEPFGGIVIRDAVVIDASPWKGEPEFPVIDTLARISYAAVKFSPKSLIRQGGIHLEKAYVKDAELNLVIHPDTTETSSATTNLVTVFHIPPGKGPAPDKGDVFEISEVQVEGFRFRMINHGLRKTNRENGTVYAPYGIDWADMDLTASVKGRNLKLSNNVMTGTLLHGEIQEKCGADIHHISGHARVGKKKTIISDIAFQDNWSDIHVDHFNMYYNGGTKDFSDFIGSVRMDGKIIPTFLDMRSIVPFAPAIRGMAFAGNIERGDVTGFVNDLMVQDVVFKEKNSGAEGKASVEIVGLPETIHLDAKAERFSFTADGLGKFINSVVPGGGAGLDFSKFAKGERFTFTGTAKGPLNRLAFNGTVRNRDGSLNAKGDIRNVTDKNLPLMIQGDVRTDNLDLGAVTGIDALGKLSMISALQGTLDPEKGFSVGIDSVSISRLGALGYDYSDILASGTFEQGAFDGRVVCNDPNLNFIFQGLFSLPGEGGNSAYRFIADLGYADLNALNIDKRGKSKVSLSSRANFIRTDDAEIIGQVGIYDIELENDAGVQRIGDVSIGAYNTEGRQRIKLSSPFANGTFTGSRPVNQMAKDLYRLAVLEPLPALGKEDPGPWESASYEVSLLLSDTKKLLSFISPGVYIADSTHLSVKVREDGYLKAGLRSSRLAYKDKYFKDLKVNVDNEGGNISGRLSTSSTKAGALELIGAGATIFAGDNHIGLGMDYDNETEADNRGEIYLGSDFLRKDDGQLRITAQILPSNLYYEDRAWSLHSGDIVLEGKDVSVESLSVSSEDESLLVSGGYSPTKQDTLRVRLDNFDLAIANSLLRNEWGIGGLATGNALVVSPSEKMPGILAGITCEGTTFGSRPLGTLRLASVWNKQDQKFDMFVRSQLDSLHNIDMTGFIKPSTREVSARAELQDVDLGYTTPFIGSIFSQIEGCIDGRLRLDGTLDKIKLSSEGLHLRNGLLQVDFTQVPYYAEGDFTIDERALTFNDIAVEDKINGKGTVSGEVLWNRFEHLALDTHVGFTTMKVLAMAPDPNGVVYGDVSGSGKVDITGELSNIELDVNATTSGKGDLHIPLSSYDSARNAGLLTFKQPSVEQKIDDYDVMMGNVSKKTETSTNLGINLKVRALPDLTVHIDMNGASNANSLTGNGSGTVEIDYRKGNLSLGGDYTLSSGGFNFSALGIVTRNFTLQEGSSMRFTGDVMDTELNIDGLYATKASLQALLADSTATARRNVNCGIKITDKLRDPHVALSIDVPDLDPSTQSLVESALNTEDKVQKQFISLLIANSFMPSEESGIVSANSNLLMSNLTSMMAGQLSNIFQTLNIPLDLGFNYQPTEYGNDVFDVAVSTQLFNNRVVVNGSIGSKKYGTNGDVAGDLDIGIKLNRQGSLRMNLFSHSADQYTSYLDNSQRNGVGVAYQRDFNNWGTFFKTLFMSRKKRMEYYSGLGEQTPVKVQIDTTGKVK